MEIQSSNIAITFILFPIILWFAKNFFMQKIHTNKLPPGPWKLPQIGNLHQLANSTSSLPHHALQKLLLKYGPLMHLQLGEISAIVVSSSEIAEKIMKTHDLAFLNRPLLQSASVFSYGSLDIAFSPYGHYWRQMRKLCTLELLSSKRVQSFSFIREQEVANLIESITHSSGSPINLTTRLFSFVSAVISRATFGNESKEKDEFVSVVKEIFEISGGFDLVDLFPSLKIIIHLVTGMKAKIEKMQRRQDLVIDNVIREYLKNNVKSKDGRVGEEEKEHETLVDVLLRIQQNGGLEVPVTANSVKAIIFDMFSAGTDTSSTTIEWAMSELMRNPRAMKKVQAEIRQAFNGKETIHESDVEGLSYLKSVIKETLRLHPPLPLLLPRECRETSTINGYEIPKKTKVIVNAYAIGTDPNHWYDADKFIPERFQDSCVDFKGTNFEFIPFGAGRRICPGMSFGLANVEFAIAKLLYHFDWELPNGMKQEELDMNEVFGLVVKKKTMLYLVPTPYAFNP